ncbi:MAG: hypothetical protein QXU79_04255 [Candidatus Micrarchaeaceae archaeon]
MGKRPGKVGSAAAGTGPVLQLLGLPATTPRLPHFISSSSMHRHVALLGGASHQFQPVGLGISPNLLVIGLSIGDQAQGAIRQVLAKLTHGLRPFPGLADEVIGGIGKETVVEQGRAGCVEPYGEDAGVAPGNPASLSSLRPPWRRPRRCRLVYLANALDLAGIGFLQVERIQGDE